MRIVHKAVRHGVQFYRAMRHHASVWDGRIQAAAHLYGSAIQPALRAAGVDTRQVDRTLKSGYDHYDLYAQNARDGIRVVDGIAANLRGGYAYR